MKKITLKTLAFVTTLFLALSTFTPAFVGAENANSHGFFGLHLSSQIKSEDNEASIKADSHASVHADADDEDEDGEDEDKEEGNHGLDRIRELLENGAGKSGKIPRGLLHAPGILKKLAGDHEPTPTPSPTTSPSPTPSPSPTTTPSPTPTPTPDATAPTIVGPFAFSMATNTGRVLFFTNEAASAKVYYSTTSPVVATSTTPSVSSAGLTRFHHLEVAGLTAGTTYYYVVTATDASGNTATSGEHSFTTREAPDVTAPVVSSVSATATASTTAEVTWTTNESATSVVFYSTATPVTDASTTPKVSSGLLVENHDMVLTGLTASTTYHYFVRSRDASGNVTSSSESSFTTPSI
ncbi:MAG: fibronectin type III domain-containing protein [Candidatus Pacebacteria bacterium]|nr:fibronectin type III domain-containing protein [Candidatus Paceibacterota bacterium]MDD5357347.1 fibronectin type III domain-containing protein [Candidatus Paceibacterota bacterium]